MKKNNRKKDHLEDLPYGQLVAGALISACIAMTSLISALTYVSQRGTIDPQSALKFILSLVCIFGVIHSAVAIYRKCKLDSR